MLLYGVERRCSVAAGHAAGQTAEPTGEAAHSAVDDQTHRMVASRHRNRHGWGVPHQCPGRTGEVLLYGVERRCSVAAGHAAGQTAEPNGEAAISAVGDQTHRMVASQHRNRRGWGVPHQCTCCQHVQQHQLRHRLGVVRQGQEQTALRATASSPSPLQDRQYRTVRPALHLQEPCGRR